MAGRLRLCNRSVSRIVVVVVVVVLVLDLDLVLDLVTFYPFDLL